MEILGIIISSIYEFDNNQKGKDMNKSRIYCKLHRMKKILSSVLVCSLVLTTAACGSSQDSGTRLEGTNTVKDTLEQQMAAEDSTRESEYTEDLAAAASTEEKTEQPTEVKADSSTGANSGDNSVKTDDTAKTDDNAKTDDTAKSEANAKSDDGSAKSGDKSDQKSDNSAQASSSDAAVIDYSTVDYSKVDLSKVDVDLTAMDSTMVYSTVYQMLAESDSYMGKVIKMKGTYYSAFDEKTNLRYYFIIIQDATACCQQGIEFVWDDGSHVFPDEYPEDGTEAEVTGVFGTYKDNPDDQFDYVRLNNASFKVLGENAGETMTQ